ncbi:hypothetical protein AK812_SmicGene45525 [Symbiodinium microadriaticum]|uniref:Uncharacterized protein n=1 Tax=Symbiodinium microadriaticum TaxID=2951 RepID=A0A1Q9BVV2_SYMMI|nr:hypothetical protein AK812_SmicGene45525 [Symbiodinium microadriaticum]
MGKRFLNMIDPRISVPRIEAAVVDLPRACARACIGDEDFFPEFADCLAHFWPMADSRQLTACWRSLLQWRVGPPGLDRCAAAVFCDAHSSAWPLGI